MDNFHIFRFKAFKTNKTVILTNYSIWFQKTKFRWETLTEGPKYFRISLTNELDNPVISSSKSHYQNYYGSYLNSHVSNLVWHIISVNTSLIKGKLNKKCYSYIYLVNVRSNEKNPWLGHSGFNETVVLKLLFPLYITPSEVVVW